MLGPKAIVNQVWQGIVPTDWRIIRGKRRPAFSLGISTTIWSFVALILLALVVVGIDLFVYASRAGKPAPSLNDVLTVMTASLAGYPALVVVIVAAAALALLAGLITWITTLCRHIGDPDPVIVFLSTGFVEYTCRHKPIIGILYADLAAINVGQRSSKPGQGNQPGNYPQTTTTRPHAWLNLRYKDGTIDHWRPRANFGPPERLYETIVKAQMLYEVLYEGGR